MEFGLLTSPQPPKMIHVSAMEAQNSQLHN
ncbi:uncharacterized protein G2W53_042846 [Senna tora]|uniref:Uncharacterized protein n=1 Tax=Senna tora TaxID=362788 RepID=A0A834W074_9FABA|nr:uncharacterized protein G2W53_042846 [Senna tora]